MWYEVYSTHSKAKWFIGQVKVSGKKHFECTKSFILAECAYPFSHPLEEIEFPCHSQVIKMF